MSDLIGIGRTIRDLRRRAGLSRASLADKSGVSRARIEALENRRAREIGYMSVRRLLITLGHDLTVIAVDAGDDDGSRKDPS